MRQWTVDAFAERPFRGNPACVVEPFDAWPEDAWMQALAQENNQTETAYLRRMGERDGFELRWFTPTMEVPLCGHATLASAHALYAELGYVEDHVRFDTRRSGTLTVARADGASPGGYVMDFPADTPHRITEPEGLAAALGVEPCEVWAGQYLLAVLDGEAAVRRLAPDLAALRSVGEGSGLRSNVLVTAQADAGQGYDVVSRFFAPGSGIPEDPATGSAHCMLAPFYAERLSRARNRFHQAYPGRGAEMTCEVSGARVLIEGQATTVVESRLRV